MDLELRRKFPTNVGNKIKLQYNNNNKNKMLFYFLFLNCRTNKMLRDQYCPLSIDRTLQISGIRSLLHWSVLIFKRL